MKLSKLVHPHPRQEIGWGVFIFQKTKFKKSETKTYQLAAKNY